MDVYSLLLSKYINIVYTNAYHCLSVYMILYSQQIGLT